MPSEPTPPASTPPASASPASEAPDGAIVEDVACVQCGCVCDDLRVTVRGDRVSSVEGACFLSEDWFLAQNETERPVASIEGRDAEASEAIERAAEILTGAQYPLIYGLSRSSTEGQRAAVRLADSLRANIDTTASLCHAPSIMAIQEVGESTCSLGEIKNRADVVVFWGVDPTKTHPRHLERYSGDAAGMLIPNGRSDRTIIAIDAKPTETAELADVFIQVRPNRDFELIWALRGLLAGHDLPPDFDIGISHDAIASLLQRLKNARCGVFFFGLGLANRPEGHRIVEGLLRLTCDLNAHTRFHARRMRIYGDVAGADTVLCWQTGYPFSVNLARGYPRYSPREYSADALLSRGEADACLLVGTESFSELSEAAQRRLRAIPTIALDYANAGEPFQPTVRFTTAVYGVHLPGTAYRMDEIPIPLRAFLSTDYPSDANVLRRIEEAVVKAPSDSA